VYEVWRPELLHSVSPWRTSTTTTSGGNTMERSFYSH
jgi:hypothetical protein